MVSNLDIVTFEMSKIQSGLILECGFQFFEKNYYRKKILIQLTYRNELVLFSCN